jgi:hypothetical protein
VAGTPNTYLSALDEGIWRRSMEVADRAFLEIEDDTLHEGVVM